MKNNNGMKILIIITILILGVLQIFLGEKGGLFRDVYRLLLYIPIILGSLYFGFKGGVLVSLIVSLVYSPYILLTLNTYNAQTIHELLDIVLFFVFGLFIGTLVEKKNMNNYKLDDELKRYMMLESYTNSIVESIKSGVIAVNKDMLITTINQGAKNIMGVGNECIGQNFSEAFTCCESVKSSIERASNRHEMIENIEQAILVQQKEMDISISIYPLIFDHNFKGLVIIVDDITEVKKLYKELLRNEKLIALGELSSGVAHEIRNPLGIIKAIEQTMKIELKDNLEAVYQLDIIDEEVERANKVIKALMEYGRPPKGQKVLFPVADIVEDVLIIMNKYFLQHGVKVQHSKTRDTSIALDKESLKQAFVNILFNAVQAMPDGGTLLITVSNEDGQFIKVIFNDSGIGIKAENLEKIFNPFYTTRSEGTGLGLAIVNRIINEHEGSIHVTSKEGIGTSFVVMLPTRREDYKDETTDC